MTTKSATIDTGTGRIITVKAAHDEAFITVAELARLGDRNMSSALPLAALDDLIEALQAARTEIKGR